MAARSYMAVLGLAALLAGCAAEPSFETAAATEPPPRPDQVRLVVYRVPANHLLGEISERDLAITGAPSCRLRDGRFVIRDVAAGPITVSNGASNLNLVAPPGAEVFIRLAFDRAKASPLGWTTYLAGIYPLVLHGPPDLRPSHAGLIAIDPVDPATALAELPGLAESEDCRA